MAGVIAKYINDLLDGKKQSVSEYLKDLKNHPREYRSRGGIFVITVWNASLPVITLYYTRACSHYRSTPVLRRI